MISLEKYNDDQQRVASLKQPANLTHMLMDTSSIELFTNQGEACFSERIYCEEAVHIETISEVSTDTIQIYQLGGMA